MKSITQGANTSTFGYDGLGDRLTQNAVHYTLDLNPSTSLRAGAGLTQVLNDGTNTYLYGVERIAQVNTTTEYFLSDALGSVRQMSNATAQITYARAYAPYGTTTQTAGAAGWQARQETEVFVHPVGAPHMLNPEKLLASATRIYGERMDSLWDQFLPVPEEKLHVVGDLEEIAIGDLRFLPIHTPGHAEHHYVYLFEDICFSGDVGGVRIPGYQYLRVPMVPPELHLQRWHDSMKRLRQEKFARIAPTHFGIYDDPEWQLREVERGLDDAERWLEQTMSEDPSPPIEALRAGFTEWMLAQAAQEGLSENVLQAYALANPPGMSADGLLRYWKKVKMAENS